MANGSGTLIDIRQSGGRSIWCWRYVVEYTYEGYMIRTPSEDCNEAMLDAIGHNADRYFGEGWPIHIVRPVHQPGTIDYPPVRVVAFFTSLPIQQDMHLSSLVLVWFQREQSPIPDKAGRAALEAVNWEQLAFDYET